MERPHFKDLGRGPAALLIGAMILFCAAFALWDYSRGYERRLPACSDAVAAQENPHGACWPPTTF